jgi:hypothetical protein
VFPDEGARVVAVDGAAKARLSVDGEQPNRLALLLESPRLSLNRADNIGTKLAAPELEGVSVRGTVEPTDLGRELKLTELRATLPRVTFKNLYWLEPWLSPDGKLRVDGQARAAAELRCDVPRACNLGRARIDFSGARLALRDRATEPFTASVEARDVSLPLEPQAKFGGELWLRAEPATAFLPLVGSLPFKRAAAAALGLADVRAKLSLAGTERDYRLSLLEASSGKLEASGDYRGGSLEGRGALLLRTPLVNVGVTFRDGATSVKPFVSNDWLTHVLTSPASNQ